jgi:hypothetical protein
LHGYETWFIILREEHRLRAFKNMVLRRIFVLKKAEVIKDSRKLNSEDFHNLYSSPIIMRVINQGGQGM